MSSPRSRGEPGQQVTLDRHRLGIEEKRDDILCGKLARPFHASEGRQHLDIDVRRGDQPVPDHSTGNPCASIVVEQQVDER